MLYCPWQGADRPGLHWISLTSRRKPPDCINLFTVPEAERQREMRMEREGRDGVGWQDCSEGKSLFPQGKVICKGIVRKSATKGRMQSGGGETKNGGAKWNGSRNRRGKKAVMGVLSQMCKWEIKKFSLERKYRNSSATVDPRFRTKYLCVLFYMWKTRRSGTSHPWLNHCHCCCDERQVWFPTSSKDRTGVKSLLFIFDTMEAFPNTFCSLHMHKKNILLWWKPFIFVSDSVEIGKYFQPCSVFSALNWTFRVNIWLWSLFLFLKGSFLCPRLDLPATAAASLFPLLYLCRFVWLAPQ